jgi:hypothetical protein
MEPDQNELAELHSPRQAYELTQELDHNGTHFDFHDNDNPFSYYDDKRDMNSSASEDEADSAPTSATTPAHTTPTNPLAATASPAVPPFQPHSPYPPVQPGENLSSKPPLSLTPLQTKPPPPAASIKLLKEAEVDLSKLPLPALGSPQKARQGD